MMSAIAHLRMNLEGVDHFISRSAPTPGFSPERSNTVELRVQDDVLTITVNGKVMARARDDTFKESGTVALRAKAGALIEKLEYLDLTVPPQSGTKASAASNEKWVDALAEWMGKPQNAASGMLVKVPGGSQYAIKGQAVTIPNKRRNIAVRATVRNVSWYAKIEVASDIQLPGQEGYRSYELNLVSDVRTLEANSNVNGQDRDTLGKFRFPEGYSADDSHTIELRLQDDIATFFLDGQKMGAAPTKARGIGKINFWSGNAGTIIEKFEYRDLGADPPAATPQSGTKDSAVSNEKWVDALAEWWAKSPDVSKGLLVKEEGGSRIADTSRGIFLEGARNITVRATVKGAKEAKIGWLNLGLRAKAEGYVLAFKDLQMPKLAAGQLGEPATRILREFAPPPEFSLTDSHTIEFTSLGDLLTVVLDGRQVAQVQDGSIKESGRIYIAGTKGTLIEKFEYLDLGADPPASPSPPASQAK